MSNAAARDSRHGSKWGRTSARKNLSMESIEFSAEDDEGIGTFEDGKTDLQNKFADDVKENTKLQHDRQKQNRRSHERHLAIEQDMASLKEQLPEEKNSGATLEAGLKLPPGTIIDDKAKADLEELALLEADLTSLEKKVNDLRMKLNLKHETKLKNKPDTEVITATRQFGKSTSKESQLGAENDNERKLGSTSFPSNHPPQNSSKRFGTKKEVANPLTKLSFRLNFMKDKGSEKGKGSEFNQPLPSPSASQGSELHSVSIQEKGRGILGSSFQMMPDKGSGKEGPSDKMGKSGNHPAEHSEKWSQHPQNLDRGKSESHKPYNVDKGR